MHFADELLEKISKTSCIVVGIDPNFNLIPKFFLPENHDPQSITDALFNFSRVVIDHTNNLIPAVKFQSAYFEQFGSTGIKALAKSISYAKKNNLLVILDIKRGDIGSTSEAYAKAYLEGFTLLPNGLKIKSDMEVDCITINPFLGEDSLKSFIDIAIQYNKGIFILVKTSNPDSKMIQDIDINGETISKKLANLVDQLGTKESIGQSGYSCIGAVVGATFPEEARELRELMPRAIHLVPGVGAQGGGIETTLANFNKDGKGAIVPISRGITYPADQDISPEDYRKVIHKKVNEYIKLIRNHRQPSYKK